MIVVSCAPLLILGDSGSRDSLFSESEFEADSTELASELLFSSLSWMLCSLVLSLREFEDFGFELEGWVFSNLIGSDLVLTLMLFMSFN